MWHCVSLPRRCSALLETVTLVPGVGGVGWAHPQTRPNGAAVPECHVGNNAVARPELRAVLARAVFTASRTHLGAPRRAVWPGLLHVCSMKHLSPLVSFRGSEARMEVWTCHAGGVVPQSWVLAAAGRWCPSPHGCGTSEDGCGAARMPRLCVTGFYCEGAPAAGFAASGRSLCQVPFLWQEAPRCSIRGRSGGVVALGCVHMLSTDPFCAIPAPGSRHTREPGDLSWWSDKEGQEDYLNRKQTFWRETGALRSHTGHSCGEVTGLLPCSPSGHLGKALNCLMGTKWLPALQTSRAHRTTAMGEAGVATGWGLSHLQGKDQCRPDTPPSVSSPFIWLAGTVCHPPSWLGLKVK